MNSDLEKMVKHHQDQFDRVEPVDEERIWMGISDVLNQQSSRKRLRFLSSAAAIVIFILTATVIYLTLEVNRDRAEAQDQFIARNYPDLKKELDQYNQEIYARKASLSFDTINPEEFPELFSEMQILGRNYEIAISDLRNIGRDEAIVRVLMRYHQRQLDLLERLSNEIEKKKLYYEKNKQHSIY